MTSGARMGDNDLCDCGSQRPFAQCCEPLLLNEAVAATAEQLMRSRYTAFARRDEAYLLATWHPDTRPSRVRFTPGQRWLGLSIKATENGAAGDDIGMVEFVARFKLLGRGNRLRERSRFASLDGHWYYLDGDHL